MDAEKPIKEMSLDEISKETATLELEMKRMQFEDLKYRLEVERGRREEMRRAHESQQQAMDDFNRQVVMRQSWCSHRKGGKNIEGILKGNDSNYAIVKHTYPWGEVAVLCTRCAKEWRQPDKALRESNPKAYSVQLAEYKEAINWPTDNEPSGSQIFMIIDNTKHAAAAPAKKTRQAANA